MAQCANFQVDPRLATLLGEYYRSSEAALKELVDNAWDADAGRVDITLPKAMSGDPIILTDNGSGMTTQEVTSEYLVVASDRRTRKGEITPEKKRKVKGRKGIGKFAGLMAADVMKVQTRARGKETTLTISKQDLISARRDLKRMSGATSENIIGLWAALATWVVGGGDANAAGEGAETMGDYSDHGVGDIWTTAANSSAASILRISSWELPK